MQSYLYKNKTYESLFKDAGFSKFRFLDGTEYESGQNSKKEEQELFQRLMADEGCCVQLFVAEKWS